MLPALPRARAAAALAFLGASLLWPVGPIVGAETQPEPAGAAAREPRRRPRLMLPGEAVQLQTKDGWALSARYAAGRDIQPTFILLHRVGGRKEEWSVLARAMQRRGMGVLALDLRGHGESRSPPPGAEGDWRKFKTRKGENEWLNMGLDVEAAAEFLKSKEVPESSIALGGADIGANLALRYAAVRSEAPMAFLLSPGMNYKEVLAVNAMRAYRNRPILMVVGADDKKSVPETAILYEFAKRSAGEEKTTLVTVERGHGTRMLLVNRGLTMRILDWIENPAHPAEAEGVGVSTPTVSTETAPGAAAGMEPEDDAPELPPDEPARE